MFPISISKTNFEAKQSGNLTPMKKYLFRTTDMI